MGRSAEMWEQEQRQEQEQAELQSFLWHSLCNLKPFISAETFQQAEREIGMSEEK